MSEEEELDSAKPPHLCEGFAERFKGIRERRRLTQVIVAKAIGVTQAAVSRWENGLDAPGEKVVAELAYLYGVTMEQLGWTRFDAIELDKLYPARDGYVGGFLTNGEFERQRAEAEARRAAVEAKRAAAAEARRLKKAARDVAKAEEAAAKALRNQQAADALRFNTPYYRAMKNKEEERLSRMSPEEIEEEKFFKNLFRGFAMTRRDGG